MDDIAQHSAVNTRFLSLVTHGGLKSLTENLLKNPLHNHGELSRQHLLEVTVGCLCAMLYRLFSVDL